MKVSILPNRNAIIQSSVDLLVDRINQCKQEYFVLGLSMGVTVLSICQELVLRVQQKQLSLKNVLVFYAGDFVDPTHTSPQFYFKLLEQEFFSKVDISPQNIHKLNGNTEDIETECIRYEQQISNCGGIDLFIGSLGSAGELAFNEPGSSLHSRTRLKTLTKETIQADARFFENDLTKVPSQALTIGIGTIMDAKEILIIVYGIQKAFAVKACLESPVSEMNPASILQFHPRTKFMVDKVAGRLLSVLISNNISDIGE